MEILNRWTNGAEVGGEIEVCHQTTISALVHGICFSNTEIGPRGRLWRAGKACNVHVLFSRAANPFRIQSFRLVIRRVPEFEVSQKCLFSREAINSFWR